jgi:hypothetical protein
VIVTGYNNGLAMYWINGEGNILGDIQGMKLFVRNSDLFFVGFEFIGKEYIKNK